MPPTFRFAHKTGDLPGVLHDVGFLYTPKGKLYDIAIMCSGLADNIQGLRFFNAAGAMLFAEMEKQEE